VTQLSGRNKIIMQNLFIPFLVEDNISAAVVSVENTCH